MTAVCTTTLNLYCEVSYWVVTWYLLCFAMHYQKTRTWIKTTCLDQISEGHLHFWWKIKYILSDILLKILPLKIKIHTLHQCTSGFKSQSWYIGNRNISLEVQWLSALMESSKTHYKHEKKKDQEFLGTLTAELFSLLKDLFFSSLFLKSKTIKTLCLYFPNWLADFLTWCFCNYANLYIYNWGDRGS